MKNPGFFFLLIIILASCNVPDDGKDVPASKLEALTKLEEINDSTTSPANKVKPIGKPLLIARGSEPGWYAEFYSNYLRLLINNGTDSLHLSHDFSGIITDKTYKKTIIEASSDNGVGSSLTLVIQIDVKPCTEMSGTNKERSITLRYNNQNLKGCAGSNPGQ